MKNEIKWYKCPKCGKKLLQYDETKGISKAVYIKCKNCRRVVEIKIG